MKFVHELRLAVYDLHRLRLLRDLRHRGTLAAVAEALNYNPSTISHQLGLLEREVGTTLLEPAGRRVRLTPTAEALVGHTENILRELEQAEAAVNALRTTVTGLVRVATFQTAAHELLPSALIKLAGQYPHVQVTFAHLHAEEALPALLARDYDLVLHETYPGDPPAPTPGVISELVINDDLLLATPPTARTHDLCGQAEAMWAMEPAGTRSRHWVTTHCRAHGFEPRIAYESIDVQLHARLVETGLAVAILPRLAVSLDATYRTSPTGSARRIWIARRAGSDASPALAAVTRAIRNTGQL